MTEEASNPVQSYDEQSMEESSISKSSKDKKLRKIKQQIEFYFSDSNLQRDGLLGKLIKENENRSVDLNIFLTFNKLRDLTKNLEDLKRAIKYSNVLELIDNETRVRRKIPFVPLDEKDIDERTIYVERFPPHADNTTVRNLFRQFGPIRFVSVPRFRTTHKIKGFAFVEFELVESVQKACEFYKAQEGGGKGNEQLEDAKKSDGRKRRSLESQKMGRKRKRSESEKTPEKESRRDSNSQPGIGRMHHKHEKHVGRKRKRLSSDSEKMSKRVKKTSVCSDDGNVSISSEQKDKLDLESSMDESASATEDITSKSKVKSSSVVKSDVSSPCDLDENVVVKNEPVITSTSENSSKTDETKNSASVAAIAGNREDNEAENKSVSIDVKQAVSESNEDSEAKKATDEEGAVSEKRKKKHRKRHKKSNEKLKFRVMPKNEWKILRNKYLNLQRKALSRIKKILLLDRQQKNECNAMLSCTSEDPNDAGTSPGKKSVENDFQPNVIVKVMLPEPSTSVQSLITDVKSVGEVAYVDASDPKEIFIRFRNSDAAAKCLEEGKLGYLGLCELITGEVESEYWEKIKKDRETQHNRPRQKKRGREKILERAEKLMKNTHIHFEDV